MSEQDRAFAIMRRRNKAERKRKMKVKCSQCKQEIEMPVADERGYLYAFRLLVEQERQDLAKTRAQLLQLTMGDEISNAELEHLARRILGTMTRMQVVACEADEEFGVMPC